MEATEKTYTQAELNEACQLAVERTLQNVREGRIPEFDVETVRRVLNTDLKIASERVLTLELENQRLKRGEFTAEEIHGICHNLHGTVDAVGFANGCAAEQVRIYGRAPDRDAIHLLRQALAIAQTVYKDACEATMKALREGTVPDDNAIEAEMRGIVEARVGMINSLVAQADGLVPVTEAAMVPSQHGVAEAEAAAQIMVMLGPLVADAALVGKTYGWDDVLMIVSAAAERLKGFVIPEDGWASIAIQMIGGTDYKSANRHFGQLEGQIVRIKKTGYLPRDYKIIEVGARDEDDDTMVGFMVRPTDENGEEELGEPDELVGYHQIDAIAVY